MNVVWYWFISLVTVWLVIDGTQIKKKKQKKLYYVGVTIVAFKMHIRLYELFILLHEREKCKRRRTPDDRYRYVQLETELYRS